MSDTGEEESIMASERFMQAHYGASGYTNELSPIEEATAVLTSLRPLEQPSIIDVHMMARIIALERKARS
jgi:hypothetical protein